jgi:hypothetical protein
MRRTGGPGFEGDMTNSGPDLSGMSEDNKELLKD